LNPTGPFVSTLALPSVRTSIFCVRFMNALLLVSSQFSDRIRE
jgi:hypothetical protein